MTFPLTLIFMFLVFWRPQEWLLPWMYGWPVLDVIVYMAVVALALEMSQKASTMPKTPAIGLAFGLFFASLMSHVAHGYFAGIMMTIPDTFKLCFFLTLILLVVNSIERIQAIVVVLMMGGIIMTVNGILQIRTGAGFAGLEPLYFYYGPKDMWITQSQFFGIFGDPNDLGQYLVACIPLAFAITKRVRFVAFLMGAGLVWLMIEGLLTTNSRGAMMGSIGVGLSLLFLGLPVRWMPKLAVIALVGGLVACAVFGPKMLDESARDRVVFWGAANQYFKHNPIFGGGFGMFGEISGTNRAAHNAFVLCYTELGLFGYWFWFNMMTLGFIGCWRTLGAFKKARDEARTYLRRVSGLLIVTMAGFAVSAFFLSRAYIFPMFILFGLMNSVPLVARRYLPDDHPLLIEWRRDVLLTGTGATLLSVMYIYVVILLLNRG
jgi:putative inorganic carbon (HCO3(-)) transporter